MDTANFEFENLIARCALKDQSAFKELFDKTSGYLSAIAFRMLHSEEMANDVIQEAFSQIWENASSFNPNMGKALTWMTSIVRYRSLDVLGKEARYNRRFVSSVEYDDLLDHTPCANANDPEAAMNMSQIQNDIERLMNEVLEEDVARCIKLAYLEGFSREEIAFELGANVNTVKSWLRRGSERLRRCLESKY